MAVWAGPWKNGRDGPGDGRQLQSGVNKRAFYQYKLHPRARWESGMASMDSALLEGGPDGLVLTDPCARVRPAPVAPELAHATWASDGQRKSRNI